MGSDLGYEDMIKYAIKELKTNHGGIVTASERLQPVCTPGYTLLMSKKKYATAINSFNCFRRILGGKRNVHVECICKL